jgi:hypothetical protein
MAYMKVKSQNLIDIPKMAILIHFKCLKLVQNSVFAHFHVIYYETKVFKKS